ncbi:MAG TPA: hypothetical protein VH593_04260 [Ktedonobacteraceae bacterium]
MEITITIAIGMRNSGDTLSPFASSGPIKLTIRKGDINSTIQAEYRAWLQIQPPLQNPGNDISHAAYDECGRQCDYKQPCAKCPQGWNLHNSYDKYHCDDNSNQGIAKSLRIDSAKPLVKFIWGRPRGYL